LIHRIIQINTWLYYWHSIWCLHDFTSTKIRT